MYHWEKMIIIEEGFGRIEELCYLDMDLDSTELRFRAVRQVELEPPVLEDEVFDPLEEDLPMDDENNDAQGLGLQGNVAVDGSAAVGNEDAAEFVDLE
ncbi:hypothetical protein AgCh_005761 [Apium graveolens]